MISREVLAQVKRIEIRTRRMVTDSGQRLTAQHRQLRAAARHLTASQRSHLERLADDLPVGPLYFQRISRTVGHLVEIGCLASSGSGRDRRYLVRPQGFAALIRAREAEATWNERLAQVVQIQNQQREIERALEGSGRLDCSKDLDARVGIDIERIEPARWIAAW